jgi:Thiolase, C-terminal domain
LLANSGIICPQLAVRLLEEQGMSQVCISRQLCDIFACLRTAHSTRSLLCWYCIEHQQAGLSAADIDVFEINEAFASQAVYCVRELGIDINKVCFAM